MADKVIVIQMGMDPNDPVGDLNSDWLGTPEGRKKAVDEINALRGGMEQREETQP